MPVSVSNSPTYRVLFLRSHKNITEASLIIRGLQANPQIQFAQFPPLPDQYRRRAPHDALWDELCLNQIVSPQDMAAQIERGAFDLALLLDKRGGLFEYTQATPLQRLWLRGREALRKKGTPGSHDFAYCATWPLSVRAICERLPVAVIDLRDATYVEPGDVKILKHCACYFKREVPYNRFTLYHAFRGKSYALADKLALIGKVHGIPLGLTDDRFDALRQARVAQQDLDIFCGARISNTMRLRAAEMIQSLTTSHPWKIDMPQTALPFEEYCRRIARSKVTVSVEGDGWDCFRHYEAVALGSLPLINKPTMDAEWWHAMPEAIYFENDFSNFSARLEQLLSNEALRTACLQELETRIRQFMLWSKMIGYMVETTLAQHRLKGSSAA